MIETIIKSLSGFAAKVNNRYIMWVLIVLITLGIPSYIIFWLNAQNQIMITERKRHEKETYAKMDDFVDDVLFDLNPAAYILDARDSSTVNLEHIQFYFVIKEQGRFYATIVNEATALGERKFKPDWVQREMLRGFADITERMLNKPGLTDRYYLIPDVKKSAILNYNDEKFLTDEGIYSTLVYYIFSEPPITVNSFFPSIYKVDELYKKQRDFFLIFMFDSPIIFTSNRSRKLFFRRMETFRTRAQNIVE